MNDHGLVCSSTVHEYSSDVPELLHILCKMALHGTTYINSERTKHKAVTLIFSKSSLKMKDGYLDNGVRIFSHFLELSVTF